MRRFLERAAALLCALALLAAGTAAGEGQGLPLQDCHRVTLTHIDTTQQNGSVVRLWQAKTAQESVDMELASLSAMLVNEIAPTLPKGKGTAGSSSRLDVETRYSRTGKTWLSFLIQARTSYHRKLKDQQIIARTYDMTTGNEVLLTDIFDAESRGWELLAEAVRTQVTAYFPDVEPDDLALATMTGRSALEDAAFTLHGMSLVLHYPASAFYADRHSLIEVTLMYPEIRAYMTDKAREETDNAAYYKFAALTFDDGPSRTNTTNVLQNLMRAGARGTFFVIGNRITKYRDQIQREHDEGHAIGAHNWHHGNVSKSKASAIRQMPGKVDKALTSVIGLKAAYDRVPYGLYPQMIKAKAGWAYIQWSLDTYDWRGRSTSNIMSKIRKEISDGDIILMHDIKDKTPETALQAANWLQENGYMLLTIDELFAKDGIELKPNTVYWHNADGETGLKK